MKIEELNLFPTSEELNSFPTSIQASGVKPKKKPSSGWRKGKGGRRGKKNAFGRYHGGGRGGRGQGYMEGLMETRAKIENMEFMEDSFRRRGKGRGAGPRDSGEERERPPPGLRGKALGMWYRDRSKRKGEKEDKDKIEPCIKLYLDKDKEKAIRRIVNSIGTPLLKPLQTDIPERIVKKRSRSHSRSPESTRSLKMELVRKPQPVMSKKTISDKYKHMEDSPFKKLFLQSITGKMMDNVNNALQMQSKLSRIPQLDQDLLDDLENKRQSPQYQGMQEFRKKLPAWDKRQELLDMIEQNQIIVISGETGCGKTTQVAQFILDDRIEKGLGSTCHIVCTQPRRISAISVAERVAAERNETLVDGSGGVGYTIRLETHPPRERGSILYCTTGILLRMLEDDPALTRVSHLILDEIHERDTISDFAITILKQIIHKRPDLHLILMSATLNADHFSKYYNNCAMINIPGFTFPVKEYYLEDVLQMTRYIPRPQSSRFKRFPKDKRRGVEEQEDMMQFKGMVHPYLREISKSKKYSPEVINFLYEPQSEEISLELIVELIRHIDRSEGEGAVLVFLPGWDKISNLNKLLAKEGFSERTGFLVIPLHSMLSTVAQKTVFDKPPPGMRKIVIATNIAETSITIDDIVFVIDCGKIKMKNLDLTLNITTLKEEWVSLANARQRKGRAGRVQEGVCYHLYTRAREQLLQSYPVPEILRTRLDEVVLQAKMLQLGHIKPFLTRVMDPPELKAIDLSLKLLKDLNALDDDEHLTPLGYHLAKLPMDPQTGKMILMGALFCVADPVFSVAASLSFKDAFTVPLEDEKEFFKKKKELSMGTKSDHLVLAEALTRWEAENMTNGGWRFTREYYLSPNTLSMLKDMKKQFALYLYDMRFLPAKEVKNRACNRNSHNIGLIKAIICAGLYPNVAIIKHSRKLKNGRSVQSIITPEDGRVNLHMRSINYDEANFEGRFLVYHLKMKTTKVYLYDSTMVFALPLIFFGNDFELFKENGMVVIELSPKIRFTCDVSTALLIKELRQRLDQLLEHKVAHPGVTNWEADSDEGKLLRAIAELISHEDEKLLLGDESDDDYYEEEEEEDQEEGDYGEDGYSDSISNSDNYTSSSHQNHRRGGPRRYDDDSYSSQDQGYTSFSSRRSQASTSGVVPFPKIW
ncbi:ATP-dependent DNA/RNA helicase DHX36-like isoform X2 [Macrosteles quadrilineatus]|uniref:ATP-dependent DNA/RNA helicase DHX36-like isoform X2 n=1 Tax=Macrosteles quadrilineatus TaxID=74068 RepID=UPI0023E25630|nr:ATP-dependent DNA/RNA helicase DHX36-like isoform X2 [Macrosteles quadrilineatus]